MKFHLLPLLASTGALALRLDLFRRDADASPSSHTLVKRLSSFGAEMLQQLQNITAVTDQITIQIQNYTDLTGAIAINTTTGYLFDALTIATAKADAGSELTFADSQALGPQTQFLAYAANESIAALIGKKPLFASEGLTSLVVTSLQAQIKASAVFSAALLQWIPADLLSVSEALNSQVTDSLNEGLACFQGQNASCNATPVNATRTIQAAMDSGAIPKSAAGRAREVGGWLGIAAAVGAAVLLAG